ncbi:unnamed protein product [Caenorhabditis bovis]|uniref:Uncharacterized protein n=1 Tax=Caenorhabditis bovis TaxID=2654633 RepID=A0A8S1FA28_9PELO|nr:unnamed protein product [Caenorhabditis bovis]
MSDYFEPRELSNAFRFLLAAQLDAIAVDGVMPSTHGALSKLLCSCYSKDAEISDIYSATPAADITRETPTSPRAAKCPQPHDDKTIIVHAHDGDDDDDTSKTQMMLSTMKNPYQATSPPATTNNHSNHRMIIEDVTDDPQYSSYGNENEKPAEEGAFIEYEKLDKTSEPAAFQVCRSTTAVVSQSGNNIRPNLKMTIGGGMARDMRPASMVLNDVEEGAKCWQKECRYGWKPHAWSYSSLLTKLALMFDLPPGIVHARKIEHYRLLDE